MKKILTGVGAVLTGTLLTQFAAHATPSLLDTTTYGGDTFSLYQGDATTDTGADAWSNAEAFAAAHGGTLAALTSDAEIQAVYNAFSGTGFFQPVASQAGEAWLGAQVNSPRGSQSTTDPSNWYWVNGATWTPEDTANFNYGEPNGDSEGLAMNRYGTYTFNDEGGYVGGFIMETATVPDSGTTLSMLGGAFALMGVCKRKFGR